jgi:dihydroxy-acid dehydratase
VGVLIEFDIPGRRLSVLVNEEELQKRKEAWRPPKPKIREGWLSRYAKLVSSASGGAVFK